MCSSIAGASFTGSPLVEGDEVLIAAYNGQQSPELTVRMVTVPEAGAGKLTSELICDVERKPLTRCELKPRSRSLC